MRNYLFGGVAIASALTFMAPAAPALAQGGCGIGHLCSGKSVTGVGQAQPRFQRHSYAHGYGRGNGYGVGVGAGLATGVIIGGAMQQGYYPSDSYVYSDPGPAYDNAGPQVVEEGDATTYCERTYRSYDPVSGTYLGYDGLRHPCP